MKVFYFSVLFIICGCVHLSYKEVPLPDGSMGYEATCSGHGNTLADCMKEAAEVCGGKYTILNRDEITKSSGNGDHTTTKASTRTLFFKCNKVDTSVVP